MTDVNRGIAAHEISEARQLADKAGLEGDRDVYRLLHALLDAYEASTEEKECEGCKDLGEQLNDVESERDTLDDRICELERENARLEEKVEALRDEIADLREDR